MPKSSSISLSCRLELEGLGLWFHTHKQVLYNASVLRWISSLVSVVYDIIEIHTLTLRQAECKTFNQLNLYVQLDYLKFSRLKIFAFFAGYR